MARPHSPLSAVRGGASGVVLPPRRSMVRPPRFSFGTNWITMLSVTIRTASRSTSGTLRPSGVASAVRADAPGRHHGGDEARAARAERAERGGVRNAVAAAKEHGRLQFLLAGPSHSCAGIHSALISSKCMPAQAGHTRERCDDPAVERRNQHPAGAVALRHHPGRHGGRRRAAGANPSGAGPSSTAPCRACSSAASPRSTTARCSPRRAASAWRAATTAASSGPGSTTAWRTTSSGPAAPANCRAATWCSPARCRRISTSARTRASRGAS